jgi:hypothetical protein
MKTMRKLTLAALALALTLLLCTDVLAQASDRESGVQPLYVGITANTLWLDAREGPFKNAAGAGANVTVSHQASRFLLQGDVGVLNMIGDPDNFLLAMATASAGILRERMSLAAEVGYQRYFNGWEGGDMTVGINGRFLAPLGRRLQLSAGGRAGLLPLTEKTTLYGGVFLSLLYNTN